MREADVDGGAPVRQGGMPGFAHIIGRDELTGHLREIIRAGKVSHAYLVEGDPGSGKLMLSNAFARALQCGKGDGDGCGNCPSCKKAESGSHPDIIYVTHEKPGLIAVDEIRSQLVYDASIRPYAGGYKIYIVEDAQKMNEAAQNALLKTLEEPPAYVVILLLCTNAENLLETVRSRCELIRLRPLPDEPVRNYLIRHLRLPDYQAQMYALFARGSIGRAVELASSQEYTKLRELAMEIAGRSRDMELSGLAALVKELSPLKEMAEEFLDMLGAWYRDVLYWKAAGSAEHLIFREEAARIRAAAQTCSYEGLGAILDAIDTAGRRIRSNVNFDLAMETMLITIRENGG